MTGKSLAEGVVAFVPGDPEPEGLWAVVEWIEPGKDPINAGAPLPPEFLVKAPDQVITGKSYWFPIDGADGWSWDQVMSWPGTVRLVREGVQS